MTMAFQSPNYTQTPNDLFDELLPGMGLAELKVVMCIVRHTFGYHKEQVKLSIRTIARFTGLTAKSVMEGAAQAEQHGLIERNLDGNKTTIWSAVVSVVPTKTRRNTKYHATVLPSKTLVGVKERKKESKDNGGSSVLTQNIFTVYEQEIGPITTNIANELEEAEQVHGANWVCEALKIASTNGKRNWAYVKAILSRWKASGYGAEKTEPTRPEYKPFKANDNENYIPNPYRRPRIAAS